MRKRDGLKRVLSTSAPGNRSMAQSWLLWSKGKGFNVALLLRSQLVTAELALLVKLSTASSSPLEILGWLSFNYKL